MKNQNIKPQTIAQIEQNSDAFKKLNENVIELINNGITEYNQIQEIKNKAVPQIAYIYENFVTGSTEPQWIELLAALRMLTEKAVVANAPLTAERKALQSKVRVYFKRIKDRLTEYSQSRDDCPLYLVKQEKEKIIGFEKDQAIELIGKALDADPQSLVRMIFKVNGEFKGALAKLNIGTLSVRTDRK